MISLETVGEMLDELPPEILERIFSYLGPLTISILKSTSRLLKKVIEGLRVEGRVKITEGRIKKNLLDICRTRQVVEMANNNWLIVNGSSIIVYDILHYPEATFSIRHHTISKAVTRGPIFAFLTNEEDDAEDFIAVYDNKNIPYHETLKIPEGWMYCPCDLVLSEDLMALMSKYKIFIWRYETSNGFKAEDPFVLDHPNRPPMNINLGTSWMCLNARDLVSKTDDYRMFKWDVSNLETLKTSKPIKVQAHRLSEYGRDSDHIILSRSSNLLAIFDPCTSTDSERMTILRIVDLDANTIIHKVDSQQISPLLNLVNFDWANGKIVFISRMISPLQSYKFCVYDHETNEFKVIHDGDARDSDSYLDGSKAVLLKRPSLLHLYVPRLGEDVGFKFHLYDFQ